MFSIYADNNPLWTPRDTDKRLLNPSVNLEVNKVGSASFKILPDHAYYNSLVKMKTIITVIQDNRIIFKGRVYSDAEDFRRVKSVTVEGILGYFNDSIVRSYSFSGSPAEYLEFLITQHNDQVEDHQKFKLGTVTVTDSNDYIVRASSDNPTTWSEITDKLINNLGGYISIRYETDGNYIDYLDDYTDNSTQDIAFRVNLLDLNSESKADTLATVIIPYGAKDEENGEVVDITSVNDGKDYVEDLDAVAIYGRICEVVTWENVTIPSNLLTKARAYLSNRVRLTKRLTVKAIDLHLADATIEGFKLGDYVQVYSKPHGINERVLLTAYNMDLSNPGNSVITLGSEKSSYLGDVNKDNTNRIEVIRKEVGESISQKSGEVLSQSQTYINEQIENSEETTQTMLKEYVTVTDMDKYKESVSTQFTQSAEGFSMQFNTVNDRITNVNDNLSRKVTDLTKYIRYVDGNIILGEVGNKLTTKIANGRISFMYNDSLEVAYISDNKLYITEAEVLDRIIIGNFAFIPRNNGNLSFKKI